MASINASTSGAGGVITTADSSGVLNLQSGGANVATINAFGIGLGTGVPASGIGITFPATQSASSNANTLDDYEEGTWTPTFSSTGATFTYNTNTVASYTKVGNIVNLSGYIQLLSVSGTTSNPVFLAGFPFASKTGYSFSGSFGVEQFSSRPSLFIDTGSGLTSASIYVAGTLSNMLTSSLNTTGYYLFTITYQSAS
jgi:hypothetical protein